jgi:AraC-like DNA-binding protein
MVTTGTNQELTITQQRGASGHVGMGDDLNFESDDLGETEEFLARAYTKVRIKGSGDNSHGRIARRWLGPISFDTAHYDYDLTYEADPIGRIVLCRNHTGHIAQNFIGGPTDIFAPGDIALVTPPELPSSGRVCQATYDLTLFDPHLLNQVAATAPDARSQPVRLTDHRPVSAAAAQRLISLVDYLRSHLLTDPETRDSPLVISTASAHLAAATLSVFPSNAQSEPTAADRRDSTQPVLLRRAVSYIDDYAHADLTVVDIAAAVHVTPRTLQYMFRQHLDTTPMEYVRRVRLHHAHQELVASDRSTTTVTRVANRWGFAHVGRFVAYYRVNYGRSPHVTLRS